MLGNPRYHTDALLQLQLQLKKITPSIGFKTGERNFPSSHITCEWDRDRGGGGVVVV